MKQILNVVLMTVCVGWLLAACHTTRTVESQVQHVENQQMMKVDSITLQTADSVLVLVEKTDTMVRIIEKTVNWRERVKVQRDTVKVYLSNDTIIKMEKVQTQPSRNTPNWTLFLASRIILIVILAIIVVITLIIKKHFTV